MWLRRADADIWATAGGGRGDGKWAMEDGSDREFRVGLVSSNSVALSIHSDLLLVLRRLVVINALSDPRFSWFRTFVPVIVADNLRTDRQHTQICRRHQRFAGASSPHALRSGHADH